VDVQLLPGREERSSYLVGGEELLPGRGEEPLPGRGEELLPGRGRGALTW